ncbi:MAG: outer membrane beta-barrel protein [Mariprofundus sp.]|nr:outer membrane beta-barrel protein [Mariprofundus sp.]
MIKLMMLIALMNICPNIALSAVSSTNQGIQVGAIHIYPVLDTKALYDNNITRSESNSISSAQTFLSPSITMLAGNVEHYLSLQYKLEYDKFWSSSIDTYTNHFIDVLLHRELSNRGRLDIGINYSRSQDQRGSTFTGIPTQLLGFIEPNRWHQAAVTAKFEYGSNGARMKLAAHGDYSIKRFENNRALTASQDSNSSTFGGTLFFRTRSRFYALLDTTYGIQDYRQSASPLSSHELGLAGGLAWKASARTSGTIKVGWLQRRLDLSGQTNSNLAWDASISWKPLSYSTWTISTSFANTETLGATGSFVQSQQNQVSWSHAWDQVFSHAIGISIGRNKYIGTARTDHLSDAHLSLIYAMQPWLDISTDYAYSRRASNKALSSYKQHLFSMAFHIVP